MKQTCICQVSLLRSSRIFSDPDNTIRVSGSLGDTIGPLHDSSPKHANGWAIDSHGLVVDLPSHCVRNVFDEKEVELLSELYCNLYKVQDSSLTVSNTYLPWGLLFCSQKTHTTSSVIFICPCIDFYKDWFHTPWITVFTNVAYDCV